MNGPILHSQVPGKPARPLTAKRVFRWLKPGNLALVLVCAVVLLPIIALGVIAASGSTEGVVHLAKTILRDSVITTIGLLTGVAVLTSITGTVCAWLVSYYDFPLRKFFSVALVLPLSVPTYIASYAFVEFFSYTGPIQSVIRSLGGFTTSREYWFPDIRSLGGCVFVLSLVLFPYVYLSVRALFHFQSGRMIESARVLGAGTGTIFFKILVPLARPAIVVGLTLAMMEAINDIGAIEYMGVETLTFSIFSLWLNQDNIAGAAQLALLLLLIAFALLSFERWGRKQRSFVERQSPDAQKVKSRVDLDKPKAALAMLVCGLPVLLGFGVPLWVLGGYALSNLPNGIDPALVSALLSSLLIAAVAATVTVLIALFLTYTVRRSKGRLAPALVRLSSIGYAIPGTVIALGIFLPVAMFDNWVDASMRQVFGIGTGLLITGSGITIIYAYAVRFMAMAEGSLDSGFKKLSPQMDAAARSLGRSSRQTLFEILLPLMRPAIATAGMLVFIDSIKELSATIMLRPFGVTTLSTYVYDFAAMSRIEEAGIACLIIVLAGLIPSIYIARTAMADK